MACEGYCRSCGPGEPDPLRDAQAAKRAALAIADERSMENVGLRDENERLQAWLRARLETDDVARAETENLRGEIERLTPTRSLLTTDERRELIKRLAAENEKLRAALENAEQFIDLYINGASSLEDGKHTLLHVREALASEQK